MKPSRTKILERSRLQRKQVLAPYGSRTDAFQMLRMKDQPLKGGRWPAPLKDSDIGWYCRRFERSSGGFRCCGSTLIWCCSTLVRWSISVWAALESLSSSHTSNLCAENAVKVGQKKLSVVAVHQTNFPNPTSFNEKKCFSQKFENIQKAKWLSKRLEWLH